MDTHCLAIRAILCENADMIVAVVDRTLTIAVHPLSSICSPHGKCVVTEAHETCKTAIVRIVCMVRYIIALCQTEFARFVLNDMPEMVSGEMQQTMALLLSYAESPSHAFKLSQKQDFERTSSKLAGYLATAFSVICKYMPVQRPIVAITLRSQIMSLSNLFNIACSLDFLLEKVETESHIDIIEPCLARCYASTKRVLEDTRKYFRLDVSGYFAFFAANVDITLRRRYVFHVKLMRAEFAKVLHGRSLKHQKREQPMFPSEIAHSIADMYAALYWDDLDPSLCLRTVGMPAAATWLL